MLKNLLLVKLKYKIENIQYIFTNNKIICKKNIGWVFSGGIFNGDSNNCKNYNCLYWDTSNVENKHCMFENSLLKN